MSDSPTPRTPSMFEVSANLVGEIEMLKERLAARDAELAEAKQQVLRVVRGEFGQICSYCGWEGKDGGSSWDELQAHVKVCPSHPLREAEARAAANEKDAQRYRWLRQFAGKPESFPDDVADPASPEEMDCAIDAAMGGRDA